MRLRRIHAFALLCLSVGLAFGQPVRSNHTKALTAKAAGACQAQGLLVVFQLPSPSPSTFSAVVGQATALDVLVVDTCGNLVGPGGQTASVSVDF